jgi:ribosomal protein S27AE
VTKKPDVIVTAKCGKKDTLKKFDAEKIISKAEECDKCGKGK